MPYMNKIDTIKAVFTYVTASLVVLGGMAAIAFLPLEADTKTILGGFVGFAAQFLFGAETATRTTRQVIAAQSSNGNQTAQLPGT